MFSRRSSRRLSFLSASLLFAVMFFFTATDGPQRLFAQTPTQPLQLTAGRNVNMVSGTKWPDGDPYLQRQNEPSIAGSTRNPLHMLAGANDYRTVDLPFVDGADETGDAWLGVFKSYDGGARWRTTLLPGYPQDTSDAGMASPLKGYQAGADPVVRAGTNGLFYYAGLVFDRTENGRSAVFVARYIDNNNQEDNYKNNPNHQAGDPTTYQGANLIAVNRGRKFLDKPWIAVDIPRDGGYCSLPATNGKTQRIPAGNVYVAFSSIYEDSKGLRSDIYLSRSVDCGATWSTPVRVSGMNDRINQGATLAIDPLTGTLNVAWRRFFSPVNASQTDAILTAQSTDRGGRFSAPGMARAFVRGQGRKTGLDPERYFEHYRPATSNPRPKPTDPDAASAELDEFDQPSSDLNEFLMFRTNAYPTMAIDGSGRIYLAWAERGFTSSPGNEARIVMSTSSTGRNWTTPRAVANESPVGHQIMPSLTYGGGRLALVYYDLREDVSGTFTKVIDDKRAIQLANKRHTMDLRASVALPGTAPVFQPSVRVSDYLVAFRKTPSGTLVEEQVQFNPPNLPMFKKGTAPFMGDYVDVAVTPAFVPAGNGRWMFNTEGSQPVFHAVWTDNRDVRQPKMAEDSNGNGNPWDDYTPPSARNAYGTATSLFDPTKMMPTCDPLKTGSRNQNIYTARLSMGLVAGSPGNTKPLSPTIQRAFVVFAQNTSPATKAFRLTIMNQPTGGRASFRQFDRSPTGAPLDPLTMLIVTTPSKSTAARSVYATSTNPYAQIAVDVVEVPYGGTTLAVPLADRIVLNPDIANPDIANPDIANPDIANPDIANAEVYNPDIANPDIANPDIANPDIANPDIANPDIANPDIANPDIANPDIANPDIANPDIANTTVANPDIANPDIANPDIANPDIANPDIANPDIANPDIANGSLSDITWTMTNDGNTTAAFNVNLFLAQQTSKICAAGQDPKTTGCIATQLILRKVYNTPVATGCTLQVQSQNVVLANIKNPQFVLPGQSLPDQNSSDPTNATLWLAPGESAKITLRVYDPVKAGNVSVPDSDPTTPTPGGSFIDPIFLPTTETTFGSITPVVQQQSVDTQDIQKAAAAGTPAPTPPIVTPLSPPVPSGEQNDPNPTPLTLAFVQQPSAVQVGSTFSASVVVRDQYGALLPDAIVTLFIGANPNPPGTIVTLSGATATSDANGVATFSALSIAPPAIGYTLVATAGQALPAVSNTFVVTAITASVTLGNLTQTYTGSALAPTVTTAPVAGLPVSLAYSQGGVAAYPRNAGTYDVVATITNPNYAGVGIAQFVINRAASVITWAAPAAIAQGTALSGTQLNATASVPGSFVYSPSAGTVLGGGPGQTLQATFTPTDTLNYSTATASVTIDVIGAGPGSLFVPGTAGGTARALTWPGQACPSCLATGPGGTAPVDSGIVLAPNEVVTVSASGAVTYYSGGPGTNPAGAEIGRLENLVPSTNWGAPTASLFARVGPGGWQYVGEGPTQIVAYEAGMLQFAVNDSNYADNGGGWSVSVTRPALLNATVTLSGFSAIYDATAKSIGYTTTPAGLGVTSTYNGGPAPTAFGAYLVHAKVVDPTYAGSSWATFKIASTLAAGGGGGGPYERYCGPGVFANGVRPSTNYYYGLVGTQLLCSDGNHPASVAGPTSPYWWPTAYTDISVSCGVDEVMVGLHGQTGAAFGDANFQIVANMGPVCKSLSTGAVTNGSVAGGGAYGSTPFYLACNTGQAVTGIVGGIGEVVDSIAVVCSPLAPAPVAPPTVGLIDLGTPTLVGGAISVPGLSGQAISFANSAFPANQYALVADQPALVATNALSISAWIYPTGPGLSYDNGTLGGEGGIIVNKEDSYEVARYSDGTIRWAFNGSPGWIWMNTGHVAPPNAWTHLVVTYDAGVVSTYLNGVLVDSQGSPGGSIASPNNLSQFRIGGRQYTDSLGRPYRQNFDGLIDAVRLYGRVLTAAEVQALAGQYDPGGRP